VRFDAPFVVAKPCRLFRRFLAAALHLIDPDQQIVRPRTFRFQPYRFFRSTSRFVHAVKFEQQFRLPEINECRFRDCRDQLIYAPQRCLRPAGTVKQFGKGKLQIDVVTGCVVRINGTHCRFGFAHAP